MLQIWTIANQVISFIFSAFLHITKPWYLAEEL
jgi:hypothetical protein